METADIIIEALKTCAAEKAGNPEAEKFYSRLKQLIQERFGETPEALTALGQYEKKPNIWEAPLKDSLIETGADKDEKIIKTLIHGSQAGVIGNHIRVDNIHFGNQTEIQNARGLVQGNIGTLNQYLNTGSDSQPPQAMRNAYLNRVLCEAGILSLDGIDPGAGCETGESQLSLWAVYTALLTQASEGHERMEMTKLRETRRISALEIADKYQHTVLLGDPGSGKSTFVNFIALCLAGEILKRPEANLERLTAPVPEDDEKKGDDEKEKRQPWRHGALLPVRIILRDFAAGSLPDSKASASDLWQFIEAELKKAALSDYAPHLKKELLEKGGLIMLDGLDEVPEADSRRVQIKAVAEDFIKTFRKCRMIVTSRTYAYQKQEWRIPGLHESVLAPFTRGQIRRFIDGWYAHLAQMKKVNPDDAQGKAEILKRAVFGSERLRELSERPLLLTLMASLHAWRGGSLPEKREELYAATVDLLLDRWERPKTVRDSKGQICVMQPSLTEWLKTDRDQMRRMLNELAYNAHAKQPELTGTADIAETVLVQGLWQLCANPDAKPAQLMEYLSNRAGLIVSRGVNIYSFPHRTFQEYLAACYLTDLDFPDLAAELCRNEPNRWREVCLLAGAKAARGSSANIWTLAEALCYNPSDSPETSDADIWGAQIAGQALAETAVLDSVSPRNQPKLERVRQRLLKIIEKNLLPATERVTAGNSLSVIGDTRFNPAMFFLPDDENMGFVRIPEGKFMMGSDKKRDRDARDNEQLHTVFLSEYWIAKYPVTAAQFRSFVRDSGYEADRDFENYPDNYPAVWVSWDDAAKYCEWLTEKLKQKGYNWKIQLPTEAQWEKAARGTDGRIYPWGDEADPDRANYDGTGIGLTSPVGCFPKGASPYGCLDMAGNVWEWCRDIYSTDIYKGEQRDPIYIGRGSSRVFRGGSCLDDARLCRSASRFNARPDTRYLNFGFRLSREAP